MPVPRRVHPADASADRAGPPLASIFLVFLKMGTFAFGGVYSMIAFFERELVERRGWITGDELADGVALGQMTPGPPIVNTGAFVGHHLRGAPGAAVATLGQVLPGFVVVVVLASWYQELRSSPALAGALRGVCAAAVGLLASVVLKLGRRAIDGRFAAVLAVAAFALLALARANPVLLLAGSGLAGWLFHRRRP
jgi:chromate transporter